MSKRVSHSLLDPVFVPMVPHLYRLLPIPCRLPPEAIVVAGHLIAIGGAFAFAFSTQWWWAGLLAAVAVAGNHLADMIDGTHARTTGQCRNGGELLDHFIDPISFAYWLIGIAVSGKAVALGFSGVIIIFATSVLTNIRTKMTGEFTLARWGPTEFKTLLVLYGAAMAILSATAPPESNMPVLLAQTGLWMFAGVGALQLIVNLARAMRQVNRKGGAVDTSEWQIAGGADRETPESPPKHPDMKVVADLCVVPLGAGVSVRKYVAACERVLAEAGLSTHVHAYGTNIEGEWDEVFAAIKKCHEVVHTMGAPRISTSIKAGTRTDKEQTIQNKIDAVT